MNKKTKNKKSSFELSENDFQHWIDVTLVESACLNKIEGHLFTVLEQYNNLQPLCSSTNRTVMYGKMLMAYELLRMSNETRIQMNAMPLFNLGDAEEQEFINKYRPNIKDTKYVTKKSEV